MCCNNLEISHLYTFVIITAKNVIINCYSDDYHCLCANMYIVTIIITRNRLKFAILANAID